MQTSASSSVKKIFARIMEITESKYKGAFALVLKTQKYVLTCLPYEGGKICSFKERKSGKEYLLQNRSKKFLHLGEDGDFVKTECAGFDDMFPTIDPVNVKSGSGKELYYPDHGEVCRLKFSYEIKDNRLILSVKSNALNYSYQKSICERKNGKIVIKYKISNNSDYVLDALWAGHCLVSVEKGDEIFSSLKPCSAVDLVVDKTGLFGKEGERLVLSDSMLKMDNLGHCPACYKIYSSKELNGGYAGIKYSDGSRFLMEFDKNLKYLGLWINNAYLNGVRCVGLEPCTLAYDTVYNAEKYGKKNVIGPNASISFSIRLSTL